MYVFLHYIRILTVCNSNFSCSGCLAYATNIIFLLLMGCLFISLFLEILNHWCRNIKQVRLFLIYKCRFIAAFDQHALVNQEIQMRLYSHIYKYHLQVRLFVLAAICFSRTCICQIIQKNLKF